MIRSESRSIFRSVARVRNSCMTTRVLPAIRAIRRRSSWAKSSFASRSWIDLELRLPALQLRPSLVAIAMSSCFACSFERSPAARRSP